MSEADDQMLAEEYGEHERWVGAYATEKKIERLEAANNELLATLSGCCMIETKQSGWCQHGQEEVVGGVCHMSRFCNIWLSIQKVKGMSNE